MNFPFHEYSWAEYRAACEACEHWVIISNKAVFTQLRRRLFYDKRTRGGARGLSLKEDFPVLGLLAGDRAEPSEECPDIAALEHMTEFPVRVLFWRPSSETLARHKNPLFDEGLGFTPSRAFAVDWLHTLSLGVFQFWCSVALHELFEVDAWQTLASTQEVRNALSTARLSSELTSWTIGQDPARGLTRVRPLERDEFGTKLHPKFPLKGAETNTMLEFLVCVVFPRAAGVIAWGRVLLQAGQSLLTLLQLMRQHPLHFPTQAVQRFHDAAAFYESAMGHWLSSKPKDHMLMHLANRCQRMGGPSLYANWTDESFNRLLRDIAAKAHILTFDRRVLEEFPRASRASAERSKRARTEH